MVVYSTLSVRYKYNLGRRPQNSLLYFSTVDKHECFFRDTLDDASIGIDSVIRSSPFSVVRSLLHSISQDWRHGNGRHFTGSRTTAPRNWSARAIPSQPED